MEPCRPVASVVVPFFRAGESLVPCLQHLLAQEAPFPFEILAVDNGDEAGAARARELAGQNDRLLRVIHEPRPGAYAARNRGLREARGGVIAFTDAECFPTPGWLAALVSALDDPAVSAAGGEVEGDPSQRSLVARYSRSVGLLSQRQTLAHPRGAFLQTANLAVRLPDAQAIEGFDDGILSGGDADFCLRLLRERPGRLQLVPGALVLHAHRDSMAALCRQFRRYGQGDVELARRYGSRPERVLLSGALDALRILLLPLATLVGLMIALVRRDPLPAAAPFLRVLRLVCRRVGRHEARRHPASLRRE